MKRTLIAGGAALALILGGGVAALATSRDDPPPPAWVNPDGTVNAAALPTFIPAVADDGATGYISAADAFPAPSVLRAPGSIPVYAQPDGGSKVVGYLP